MRWLVATAVLCVAVATIAVYPWRGTHAPSLARSNEFPHDTMDPTETSTSSSSSDRHWTATPRPVARETPPWEATPGNTPAVAANYWPAWKVNPPAPDPESPRPPDPVPPPDPRASRPALVNPGGVNGDRPARMPASP
jgi:hypothetical protein